MVRNSINIYQLLKGKTGFLVFCIILAGLAALIYGQTFFHEFVFDDESYIVNNLFVSQGITGDGISRAFQFSDDDNNYWQPLTWISHMVDVEVFGLNPAGHHMVNVVIHILNAILLLCLLYMYTGNMFASCIVALLFAVHPLNVESVAWAASRKNLLSSFFGLWTIIAFKQYTDKPGLSRYSYILLLYALCLLTKPALVVLPLLLLLLDFWPLGRLQLHAANSKRIVLLVAEKVPLLVLSLVSVIVSTTSLRQYGLIRSVLEGSDSTRIENAVISYTHSISEVPLTLRIENALVSYLDYLIKIIWPDNLAVFYPYPESLPVVKWLYALIVLSVITTLALKMFNAAPFILFGWLWFLLSLLPVSGLIQAGMWPAMADRWVYIPAIGIFVIVAWFFVYAYESFARYRMQLILAGMFILVLFSALAYKQTALWKNQLTLFEHSVKFAENSYPINLNYATALLKHDKVDESIVYFYKALTLHPAGYKAHYNLGNAFIEKGNYEKAIYHFKEAIKSSPEDEKKYFNLAVALEKRNQHDESLEYFKKSLVDDPDSSRKTLAFGGLYEKIGNLEEANRLYTRAIRLDPENVKAYNALAILLFKQGQLEESIQLFNRALQIDPDDQIVKDNLSKALSLMPQRD